MEKFHFGVGDTNEICLHQSLQIVRAKCTNSSLIHDGTEVHVFSHTIGQPGSKKFIAKLTNKSEKAVDADFAFVKRGESDHVIITVEVHGKYFNARVALEGHFYKANPTPKTVDEELRDELKMVKDHLKVVQKDFKVVQEELKVMKEMLGEMQKTGNILDIEKPLSFK